ncbi:hypothetical protein WJX74_008732 [Apatococcus lobatus]|uniref:Uncharacterized protein n=1 Tax=Apatococcus lobatus TaxID=904363 RepID=A0AAW1SH18_9CHLO
MLFCLVSRQEDSFRQWNGPKNWKVDLASLILSSQDAGTRGHCCWSYPPQTQTCWANGKHLKGTAASVKDNCLGNGSLFLLAVLVLLILSPDQLTLKRLVVLSSRGELQFGAAPAASKSGASAVLCHPGKPSPPSVMLFSLGKAGS